MNAFHAADPLIRDTAINVVGTAALSKLAYGAYRVGSRLRSAAMPGKKRTAQPINKQGFRTKIRRRNLYGQKPRMRLRFCFYPSSTRFQTRKAYFLAIKNSLSICTLLTIKNFIKAGGYRKKP